MRSSLAALAWEIWQRGRLRAYVSLGCVSFCALVNLSAPEQFVTTQAGSALYGLLMIVSFLLVFGIFNYTEFNSTKEWNGFPYRLFALPVRTWQLVTLPMLLGVIAVELVYMAWIKLVWTHEPISAPGWFAVVLGAYMIFYQTTLWSLAGLRIFRIVVLGLGGTSGIGIACLPLMATFTPSPWFSERRLIPIMIGLALLVFVIAWTAVARQRGGGGLRRNWIKTLFDKSIDAVPTRHKDFVSPAAAQFWFEWRRTGWLLPVCTAFTLIFIIGPISWFNQADTVFTLICTLAMPVVLAFAIGKGFVKAEFWSTNLSLPAFLAAKPLRAGEFVINKMKVAALSASIAWLFVLGFIALWLPHWGDTTSLNEPLFIFCRMIHPHSWLLIAILYFAGLVMLTWRCMVGGLWVGLSGSRRYYLGSLCLQAAVVALLLLACGICSGTIDSQIQNHPDIVKSVVVSATDWTLTLLVILKLWFAVFSWSKITHRRTWQYLLIWSGVTLCFVVLAILSAPWADTYRVEHLSILAALLLVPFARLGLAPLSLAKNRHR